LSVINQAFVAYAGKCIGLAAVGQHNKRGIFVRGVIVPFTTNKLFEYFANVSTIDIAECKYCLVFQHFVVIFIDELQKNVVD
jgi:hypothetical protein